MPRKLSRRRKALFVLVTLVGAWVLAELLAWGFLSGFMNYSFASLQVERSGVAAGRVSRGANNVVHPYTGWVIDPHTSDGEEFSGRKIGVNELGIVDSANSIVQRSDETFILGIAGGSVAWQMSVAAEETLVENLEASPQLGGRKVRIVRLAVSGYKQPQQLMQLNYLMSLGAEFDAVVNIDGYNEMALTLGGNARAGVAYSYPWTWQTRTMQLVDPRDSADYALLLNLRGKRQAMAQSMENSWSKHSALLNLIWKFRDRACETALHDLGFKMFQSTRDNADRNFAQFGPKNKDGTALQEDALNLWRRSSVLMHNVSRSHGAVYIHVLQPNRHHDGAKPMSNEETKMLELAVPDGADAVREMYPKLMATGKELRAAGVHFSDQTALFRGMTDTIYSDAWCHLNDRGSRMLAEKVVDEIIRAVTTSKRNEHQ